MKSENIKHFAQIIEEETGGVGVSLDCVDYSPLISFEPVLLNHFGIPFVSFEGSKKKSRQEPVELDVVLPPLV